MGEHVGYPRPAVSEELPTLDESKDATADGDAASPAAVDVRATSAGGDGGGEPPVDTASAAAQSSGSRQARRKAHQRRNAIEWVVVLAGALIIAIVIKTFLFQAFFIPSPSMEPTLKVGDRVLVNKLSYRVHDVNHGDIVVFGRPSTSGQTVDGCDGGQVKIAPSGLGGNDEDLIKRVIATGGDTVEQRDGSVYVNGQQLVEPYVHKTNGVTDKTPAFSFSAQCIKVPQGDVFVLGDNRRNSSASNAFGPIPASLIVGRAFIRVWPLGSIGGI